ncbi:MAG: NAD(+)/NADH kinase [Elusimicrobiota bacterium]|jgi:NAD+ kinase
MHKKTSPYQRVALVYNPDKERARTESARIKRWLRQHHVQVKSGPRVTAGMKNVDVMVALGGDGTVLRVARTVAAWGIPVLGVNVGHLGFLAATDVGGVYRTLLRLLDGKGRIENRTLLSVSGVSRGKKFGPYLALNDAVIRSGSTGRLLRLQAFLRDRLLATYAGDGLIVSTPTGSTAYNLAASGPILYPDLDVLLVSPICPHTLAQRPLVLPTFEIISVRVDRPNPIALLSMDGQVSQTLWPGDRIEIRRAVERVQLLMDPDRSFYQVLQSKLKWGGA